MKTFWRSFRAKYRYSAILLRQLVKTDFKLRYQGSILGYLWSLLRPLALFAILYFVFVRVIEVNKGSGIPHFGVYLLLGVVLWNFFVEVTTGGVSSIVGKGELIRKINFPKYVIPLAGSLSALINLSINLIVVVIFMIFADVGFRSSLLLVPIMIAELYLLSLSLSMFLSTVYVKYRDIGFIWEVVLQAAFYATPILYPLSIVGSLFLQKLLMLNPMAQIIQDTRALAVTNESPTISSIYGNALYRLIPLTIVVLIMIIAAVYFKLNSKKFAEFV